MKRTLSIFPLLAAALLLGEKRADAQVSPYAPYSQPLVSPYLNLLRGGANPGLNYYDLVQPQLNFRAGINSLAQQAVVQQQLLTTGLPSAGGGYAGPPITGVRFGFQTQRAYFLNEYTGGLMGGGQGGVGAGAGGMGLGVGTGGPASFGLGGAGGLPGGGLSGGGFPGGGYPGGGAPTRPGGM